MNNKKIFKNNTVTFLVIGIIILIMFLYFSYKIEYTDALKYKDSITGELIQNIGAKKISYIILTTLSIYTILMFYFMQEKIENKKINIEKIFLIIIASFCILMTLAMPMSKGHDETIHGLRIYEYAEGKLISDGKKAYLEEAVINALNNKQNYQDLFDQKNNYSTDTKTIKWGYRIASYSPLNYMPQVIGIYVSRFVTTNSMIHLYVARLCNIATCILMLYFAIKLIPFGKNLLFLLSVIPISIEGFSTLSADGMLVSVSFLWISYIFHLIFMNREKINKKDVFILSIISIILALSKTIYIVLLPLLFLIPKEKWTSNKKRIIIIALICIICAIFDIGWYSIGIKNESSITGNNAIEYILLNPISYIQKIIGTIIMNFEKYVMELFGGFLEWNENVKINVFPYLLLIISVITITKAKEKINFNTIQKLIIGFIIISCVFLVFTSMFLGWSNVELDYIEGIQGRYFMPIIPLIFISFGRKLSDDMKITKLITITSLLMQMYVIMEIFLYHI